MSSQGQPDHDHQSRHELHNTSVDESVAAAGACAQVHLPTGRVCALPQGHGGSCDFTPPDQAPTAGPERN